MRLSKIHKQTKEFFSRHLTAIFVAALMIPVVILIYTEKNPFWVSVGCTLVPLGGYMLFAALLRRSGVVVWLGLPLIVLSAFQIILSYLFGHSVVAADMFLNLITTNIGEAGELISSMRPAIVIVAILYIPLLWVGAVNIYKRRALDGRQRRRMAGIGIAALLTGCGALAWGTDRDIKSIVRDELFPANALYNMDIAISEAHKISNYAETSRDFEYNATRRFVPNCKEVYVLVIGESSRAASWQAYGYERNTTPRLASRKDVVWFRNVLTQNNTTHKSVPMMLSSAHPSQYGELHRRSGILALFNEVGFATYFISAQAPQGAMIDNLAREAQHIIYIDKPHQDIQLVAALHKAISSERSEKIFFVLHTYGSHFNYRQRYTREFARFTPDDDVAIRRKNAEILRNAYDNSIYYTDHFLTQVISTLDHMDGAATAMYYCADHGEDIFDDGQKRFLHSSPTVTYQQLHIASLAWFSTKYKEAYAHKVEAALKNTDAPSTTYSVFHTMADMADITSAYVADKASLINPHYDRKARRYYLNDHNQAVEFGAEIGLNSAERPKFLQHGIEL